MLAQGRYGAIVAVRWLVAAGLLVTGCNGCEAGGPGSKLTGRADESLSNGFFGAKMERIVRGPDPIQFTQIAHTFTVMLLNTQSSPLEFSQAVVVTVGDQDAKHTNTKQADRDGTQTMRLDPGEGFRFTATTPEASIPEPRQLVVGLTRNGKSIGEPLTFDLSNATIEGPGKGRAASDKAAGAKKLRSDPAQPPAFSVRYDGLYMSGPHDVPEAPSETYCSFLRFYKDGTVISVGSDCKPEMIARWFTKEHQGSSAGKFAIHGHVIEFSIEGNVDYNGTMEEGSLKLQTYSHMNGHDGSETFHFLPVRF